MNIRRILALTGALGAVLAAGIVVVVAASFAVYAAARPFVGEAWAAAIVAGVFALVAVVVAWLATRKVAPKPLAKAEDAPLIDRLIVMAKERPLIALGAAAAGAVVLIRNPAVVTALVSAFMAGSASKPEK